MRSGECRFFNGPMAKKDAPESFILSSDNLTSESDEVDVKRKGFSRRFIR